VIKLKSTFKLLYYIGFIAVLWLLNRHFQAFVAVNGILQGVLAGLVLAFVAKLIFKTITRTIMSLIVIVATLVFLVSIDFFVLPDWLGNILIMVQNY